MKEFFAPLPLILDGATGTQLQKLGMPPGCCTERWVLENGVHNKRPAGSGSGLGCGAPLPLFALQGLTGQYGRGPGESPGWWADRKAVSGTAVGGDMAHRADAWPHGTSRLEDETYSGAGAAGRDGVDFYARNSNVRTGPGRPSPPRSFQMTIMAFPCLRAKPVGEDLAGVMECLQDMALTLSESTARNQTLTDLLGG